MHLLGDCYHHPLKFITYPTNPPLTCVIHEICALLLHQPIPPNSVKPSVHYH